MVTIQITKSAIYSIAEGISVTISLHNGGTPAFEQLWASPSESQKLDIYYRQAVSDLERHLMTWATQVHAQFDLTQSGDDYTLTLSMGRWWPSRLEGLLANKIQDYLVHAVTAGWLNDFDGIEVKIDYMAVAASDIADIQEIIHQRAFDFDTSSREFDADAKQEDEYDAAGDRSYDGDAKQTDEYDSAGDRAYDADAKQEDEYDAAGDRSYDGDAKQTDEYDSAGDRAYDADAKQSDEYDSAGERASEEKKDSFVLPFEAGFRRKDNVRKNVNGEEPFLCRERTDRHRDNAVVCHHENWTDMSGTGMAYGVMDPVPTRPMMGMGYTPAPDHHIPPQTPPYPPVPPQPGCPAPAPSPQPPLPPKYDPRKDPKVYPDPPYHAVPPHYPPVPPLPEVHANGVDWSDMDVYPQEQEQRFVDSHICGQRDCPSEDMFGWADDDNSENNNN